jgi:hypothetical protein
MPTPDPRPTTKGNIKRRVPERKQKQDNSNNQYGQKGEGDIRVKDFQHQAAAEQQDKMNSAQRRPRPDMTFV